MKTKKEIIRNCIVTLSILMILISKQSSAQPAINSTTYNNAIGFRFGETSGISVKHFLHGGDAAIEGIVGIWPDAFSLTGLYEKYYNAGVAGLNWYYGGGAHLFVESGNSGYFYYRDHYYYRDYYATPQSGLGVDGIIGIEYKIRPVPFAISFDLKPFLEANATGGLYFSVDPGLGIKFAF